jgi:hypothetical protein
LENKVEREDADKMFEKIWEDTKNVLYAKLKSIVIINKETVDQVS